MVLCEHCGEEFSKVANHWRYNPSHRPKITEKQLDILTGCLMSDGTLEEKGNNPSVVVYSGSKEYLEYLSLELENLTSEVRKSRSAKDNAERLSGNVEDYQDEYRIRTASHPDLLRFKTWYSSGEKIWPEVEMNFTVFKHLFAGDGYLHSDGRIEVIVTNESKNKDKVLSIFEDSELPNPYWMERGSIRFSKSNTKKIFKFMNEPVPGYEYKWPKKHRS